MSENTQQPGFFGKFFKGAVSGALSGALMMGIVKLISLTGLVSGLGPAAMAGMVLCTALFSGTMSVMRGESRTATRTTDTTIATTEPVISQSMGRAPNMDLASEAAPTRADGKSWVETAGRSEGTQSRIDSILANGSLSDKGRAEALLAARQNGANTEQTLG